MGLDYISLAVSPIGESWGTTAVIVIFGLFTIYLVCVLPFVKK